jgi:hypothetical protein
MPTFARRHHYVPRCYLKGFSTLRKANKQTIQVFDKKNGKAYPAAIENVAVERDFNTVHVEGLDPDALEKAAADFESELAPALGRIIESRSLEDPNDTGLLLNFIAWLATRNPRLRENVRDFHERIARQVMNLALATPQRWSNQKKKLNLSEDQEAVTYEEMKAFVERKDYTVSVPTETHIQLEAGTFEKVLQTMFERKWVLLKAPKTSGGFITSDHPVCLTYSQPRGRIPIGYGLRNTEVIFPISPGLAVVGAFELEHGEMEIDEGLTAQFNGTVAVFAERQVYSRDHHFHYSVDDSGRLRKASRLASDLAWRRQSES